MSGDKETTAARAVTAEVCAHIYIYIIYDLWLEKKSILVSLSRSFTTTIIIKSSDVDYIIIRARASHNIAYNI